MTNLCVSRQVKPNQLFCYGTLCLPEIMRSVCGRQPDFVSATLMDYACYSLTGKQYPAIAPVKGEKVDGVLYTGLQKAQYARLDAYEGEEYWRRRVWVDIGLERVQAWTYILRPRYHYRLSGRPWSLEHFRRELLKFYIANRLNTH